MASTSKGGGSLEPPASGVPGSIPGQVILGGHEWPFDPDGSAGANDSGPPPPPQQQQQQPPPTNPPPDLTSHEDENFASTLDMEAIKRSPSSYSSTLPSIIDPGSRRKSLPASLPGRHLSTASQPDGPKSKKQRNSISGIGQGTDPSRTLASSSARHDNVDESSDSDDDSDDSESGSSGSSDSSSSDEDTSEVSDTIDNSNSQLQPNMNSSNKAMASDFSDQSVTASFSQAEQSSDKGGSATASKSAFVSDNSDSGDRAVISAVLAVTAAASEPAKKTSTKSSDAKKWPVNTLPPTSSSSSNTNSLEKMCHSNNSSYHRSTMQQHNNVAGPASQSNITGNCSSNVSATTDSDNKAASGEGEVPATAASEAEDFAHLAEQLQLDQISKDGNGTEAFQMIEEEDLVAILKDVAAGGNSDDFSLSSSQHQTQEAVSVSLANQMDLIPAASSLQQVQQMPGVTTLAAPTQLASRQQQTPSLPGLSAAGCSSTVVVTTPSNQQLPQQTVSTATAGPITVKTVTLCQPPLPPPPAMAALEPNSFIPTKPIIPFHSAASKTATSLGAKKTSVNRPLAPAPPKQLTTAYVRLPVNAASTNLAAVATQRQRLSTIKKRKSRKSRQLLPAVTAPPTQAVAPITGILQHVLPVQAASASSQFAPAAAAAATTADFDSLYLNSSTSNVSPDSGIQSEGVNSPLHLGDSLHTATASTVAVTASTLSPTLYAQQHQTISMQQLGCNGTVLTSTQTRQAAANWATAAATAPISPQFPAAAGTAFIVQQSSTTQQSQFVQNQTNVAQTTYVYTNGPAPFLVGSATHHTTTSQNHLVQPPPQQPPRMGSKKRSKITTPPPTLLPAMPAIFQASNAAASGTSSSKFKDCSSSSSAGSGPETTSNAIQIIGGTGSGSATGKRGRGRPKGSKNRTKTTTTTTTKTIVTSQTTQQVQQAQPSSHQVTMVTSGSQTEERSLETTTTTKKKKVSTAVSAASASAPTAMQVLNYSSSETSGDEADEDSDSGFSLPPPVLGGAPPPVGAVTGGSPGGRAARKDPPTLIPETVKKPVVKRATTVMEKEIPVGSATTANVTASCDMLDSDDSIVFSDNEDSSSDEDDDVIVTATALPPAQNTTVTAQPPPQPLKVLVAPSSKEMSPKVVSPKVVSPKVVSPKVVPNASPAKVLSPRVLSSPPPLKLLSPSSHKAISPSQKGTSPSPKASSANKANSPSSPVISPSSKVINSISTPKVSKTKVTISPHAKAVVAPKQTSQQQLSKVLSKSKPTVIPAQPSPPPVLHSASKPQEACSAEAECPPPLRPEVTPVKRSPPSPEPPVLKAAVTPAKVPSGDDLPPTLPRMRTPSPEPTAATSPPPLSIASPTVKVAIKVGSKHKKKKKDKSKKKKRSRHTSSPDGGGGGGSGRSSRQTDKRHAADSVGKKDFVFEGANGTMVSLAYSERSKFSFEGAGQSVFASKFSTLKKSDLLWEKPEPQAQDGASSSEKPSPAAGKTPSQGRILTKGFIKEIFTGVSGGAGAGASTRTMMAVLEEASKRQPAKPGRKKGKKGKGASGGEEWSDTASRGGSVKGKDSPGSSCHSSNKSPFSPRSSIGSDQPGEELNNIKYGGMLDCSMGYKTKDKSAKKAKRDKQNGGKGPWKSKHKNVVDPVFLCDIDSVTQDLSACQIEISQVSSNYWPERPHDSVPSIFRKRKIKSSSAEEAFDKLLHPTIPEVAPAAPETKPPPAKVSKKTPGKRGRPKSTAAGGKTDAKTGGDSSDKASSAEQRLPLKKRHRHHLPAKSGSTDGDPGTVGNGRRVSKEGRGSRKPSTEGSGGGKNPPQRRMSAADRIAEKLNIKVKKNSIDSMAACVEKYTGGGGTAEGAKPPQLEKVKGSAGKRDAKAMSPPRLSPQRCESPELPDLATATAPTPPPPATCHQPKYSDISDDEIPANSSGASQAEQKPASYYTNNVPSAQSLTSASAEEAFDKLLQSDNKKPEIRKEPVLHPPDVVEKSEPKETLQQEEPTSKPEKLKPAATPKQVKIKVKPVKKPKEVAETAASPKSKPPPPPPPSKETFADLEADIQPLVVKQPEPATQNCSVIMNKLQDEEAKDMTRKNKQQDARKDVVKRDTTAKDSDSTEASRKDQVAKKRKRKANKTGFPSVKKKKRTDGDSDKSEGTKKVKKSSKKAGKKAKVHTKIRQSSRIINKEEAETSEESKPTSSSSEASKPENVEVVPAASEPHKPEPTEAAIKKPRGRPPKRKAEDEVKKKPKAAGRESSNESSASSIPPPAAKRSRSFEDESDSTDCLALLPLAGMESGPSSEAPSGAETDNNSTVGVSALLRKKRKKVVLFKKKGLVAGLFSDFYKAEGGAPAAASKSDLRKMTYVVGEHPHGLLPPPYYCGRQLRAKKDDFQLPYDLWWMHVNKQLPGRDVAATWNYKRIKNNIYFDVKPWANFDAHACQCSAHESGAGCCDDCINRMTYTECDARTCPTGDRCTNNQIQKHRFTHGLERFMTEAKGWGVKTKVPLRAGQFIMEYVGEVVSEGEFKLRMTNEYADDTHHYCMHMDGGIVIDGHRMGGECRFVNHSCQPNCEMQKWCVNGLYRMALFSRKEIEPNEELTYDYNFSLFNPHEGQACKCGSDNCRGVIGGRTQRVTSAADGSGGPTTTERRNERKKSAKNSKNAATSQSISSLATRMSLLAPPIKPLSKEQVDFVVTHRCFLFRNFEKIRLFRDRMQRKLNGPPPTEVSETSVLPSEPDEPTVKSAEEMIKTGLTALATARSMQTRRLAIVQDDPNVTKVVKLAQILREIYAQVTSVNDSDGKPFAKRLQTAPNKKKFPSFYTLLGGSGGSLVTPDANPVPDLAFIEKNISTGSYNAADQFDRDVLRLFQNFWRYFGRDSHEGEAARILRKVYHEAKPEYVDQLTELLGPEGVREYKMSIGAFGGEGEGEEDRIDCFCGQYKDEGLMIQCEKCQVWQHCDCVAQTGAEDEYVCAKCLGRSPNLDIPVVPQPEYAQVGETYYVSMVRAGDDMQLRVGDTVYVLRAQFDPGQKPASPKKARKAPKAAKPEEPSEKPSETPTEKPSETEEGTNSKEGSPALNGPIEQPTNKDTTQVESTSTTEVAAKTEINGDAGTENANVQATGGEEGSSQFSHGGIPHKMMSPLKGPSLEASTLKGNNYPTYKSVDPQTVSTDDMDIFRIERLWTNEAGEKFAFGHHYLRPHETFHEPSRKFFNNEVFRVPIHEVLPIDTIWKQCWVLDIPTFGRGRPIGAVEEHVYICEYRVDKTARLFNKISKPKYPTCTKWFAFDLFDHKLKPQRCFTPHAIPIKEDSMKASSSSNQNSGNNTGAEVSSGSKLKKVKGGVATKTLANKTGKKKGPPKDDKSKKSGVTAALAGGKVKPEDKSKSKLETTLLRLLSKLPKKNAVDASYLLDRKKRARKKSAKNKPSLPDKDKKESPKLDPLSNT